MVATRRLNAIVRSLEPRLEPVAGNAIACISGGADSAIAAWLAAENGATEAVHVDHGLPASAVMRDAAEAIAARLSLGLRVVTAEATGDSEGRLRTARYDALGRVGDDTRPLVLGHTADDQAETVVMNLMRGSGVRGLAAMAVRRGRFHRPLLSVWRSETRELASLLELPWRDDPANRDLRHLRNRIRLDLIPSIEGRSSVDFRSILVRTAESARDDLALVEELSASIPVERGARGFRMPVGAARAAGFQVTASVLRRELALLRSGLPPDRAVVERAIDVIEGRRSAAELGAGLVVRVIDAAVLFTRETDSSPPVPPVADLKPGPVEWGRFHFDVALIERLPVVPLSLWAAVIPVRTGSIATVRSAQPDEIRQAGARTQSGPWPAVDLDGELVWIPGIRRSRWRNQEADGYLCAVADEESDWARFEP